ncbi:MAG: nitrate reductase [Gammaproteobacteria bacterium]|nr:nitrate reductase [Gammaproteobacteria bacterium]MBU1557137.1 nitrate reductase [Gammaproteobacteria bacterium]MBU2069186.1 nitrate reductase [Gammaproteobacteria bacterium]MBU2184157.1 nitrate reductase [Gammaproteobacteria bacterium]MBU2204947.1 nitrate reductase [Gammaproteobacteria bacterium]
MSDILTTCPYCGVGCGIRANLTSQAADITGDSTHPANFGRLCVKGSALGQTLSAEGRLLQPQVNGEDCDWPAAITAVAEGLQQTIAEHGPGAVAMYLSGQLLTEDYYVANKLMKGFIGSAHVDTNSRLCMASTVAGHKRAFGADVVPGCYDDIEQASLFVLVGANMAWNHPVLFRRIQAVLQANPEAKLVVIDPRRSASCEAAQLHLKLRPGTDVLLFNGLLSFLAQQGKLDQRFINLHTDGFAEALASAQQQAATVAQVASGCDLPADQILQFYRCFADEPLSLTLFSQGVNQAIDGTDKVNAIINCHLATGRIGKPGCGPFSLTGQPNAMGGREVGGLANQLAAHIDYTDKTQQALVGEFWQAPKLVRQPGYKAVELFAAIERGEIKAVWIMATNPLVSMPQADKVKAALAKCPLVIVSDIYQHTDTLALASIKLPALGWSEKDGTVTNSERRISRQRALCPPPGQAKADWQIICEVAKAMGFTHGFNFSHAGQIFAEHAALSGYQNSGKRAFNISALARLSAEQYQQLAPIQWPVTDTRPQGTTRLFADGNFFTANGRAQFIALRQRGLTQAAPATPLWLNSGRLRDQWHSMTRTGSVAGLMQHTPEPFVTLHPADAALYGVTQGELVQLSNAGGRLVLRADISANQRPGELFVPMHWSAQFASQARVDTLFAADTDAISGQPALKLSQVALRRFMPKWQALLLTKQPLTVPQLALFNQHYLARVPLGSCQSYRLGLTDALDPRQLLQQLQLTPSVCCSDSGQGQLTGYRAAAIDNNQLQWLLLVSTALPHADQSWLNQQFSGPISAANRRQLLSGRAGQGKAADNSALICSCFNVRSLAICQAITAGADSTAKLGKQLNCGTNCGSCLPELSALLKRQLSQTNLLQGA